MGHVVAKRRFTADEFHRMGEAGILGPDDRVELIEGEIVEMSPIGERHAACVDWLTIHFAGSLKGRAFVRVQNPVRLGSHSEPQPDLALLRLRDDYGRRHPGPGDTLLVVEVADTSEDFDRQTKIPAYAAAGIPESWLVVLSANAIEVYRDPSPSGYRQIQKVAPGGTVAPLAFPDLTLPVSELFKGL